MEQELRSGLASLGVEGASAAASAVSGRAEDYTNNQMVEQLWAIKAMKYAETHMKILQSKDALTLTLTKYDDEMYERYMKDFKDLEIRVLNPDHIKSEQAKEVWRPFCAKYEGLIIDYNFATLIRLDVSKDYSEENTIIVPRVQFLAIEVARNKSGLNSIHFTS